jgi:ankyrin repeat protein
MSADGQLRHLITTITAGDTAAVVRQLAAAPELARARFEQGATREKAQAFFLREIDRYIVAGDTALHIAAAAHNAEMVDALMASGADVRAANRFGDQALHVAARSNPSSERWNPAAQTATIAALIEAGADPNAVNKRGVAPLHVAVRTRSAAAVRVLLERGADPARKNNSGSMPLVLAKYTTGRGGSGSPEAKEQQKEILRLLTERLATSAS